MYTENAEATGGERTEKNLVAVIEAAIDKRGWAYAWGTPGNRHRFVGTTIGLARTFGHPELCVLSANGPEGGGLLGAAVDRIRRGIRFVPARDYEGIIEGYSVRFRRIPEAYRQAWFFLNERYYDGHFSILQLIWSDRDRIPDASACDPVCIQTQSLQDLEVPMEPIERRVQ